MTNEKVIEVLARYDKEISLLAVTTKPNSRLEQYVKLTHLRFMCRAAQVFVDAGRKDKAMRWLGFVQGCLVCKGLYTIDQLKEHNKPKEDL